MTHYNFFQAKREGVIADLGKERLLDNLRKMLLIRNFEKRGEAAYQQGKVGGFYHSYLGQEAIATAAVQAFGVDNWWITSYRCHALALLLGATPEEIMAELYGRADGNAKGRGGSMHLFTDHLLGGHGIVGGQIPIAIGAAFSAKYLANDRIAICFLGDGAAAQGSLHESLNLASLWSLPVVYVIENNQWGMGTAVNRALSFAPIAEKLAPAYNLQSVTLDGMDFFGCYAGFTHICHEVKKSGRPILVEAVTERFRGHSISDPALYRSKEALAQMMEAGPIERMAKALEEVGIVGEEEVKEMDSQARDRVKAAMEYAEKSPWPSVATLEEDVYAP
jgi:pyruvate dehydrogenase E1 component subunit alpha